MYKIDAVKFFGTNTQVAHAAGVDRSAGRTGGKVS